jgi:hypothetical protein
MQLKANLLLNKIQSFIDRKISEVIEEKNKDIYKNLENFRVDQIIKNQKIDDLNKKISLYEKENKALLNDILVISNVLKDVFTTVEFLSILLENDFDPNKKKSTNKKKIIH